MLLKCFQTRATTRRSYMDQEIRAIMSQYMPLEEDGDGQAGIGGGEDEGSQELRNAV